MGEATLSISHTNRAREKGAHHQLHLHHRLSPLLLPTTPAHQATHTHTHRNRELTEIPFFITQRVKCTRHQKKEREAKYCKQKYRNKDQEKTRDHRLSKKDSQPLLFDWPRSG